MKLFTATFSGNLHETVRTINEMCPEIVPGVVTMDYASQYTIVVYRAEEEHPKLKPRATREMP